MSTAATRSTTVRPRISRSTPSATPRKIRIAATMRIVSAKCLLQMFLEWTGDGAGCLVCICCFYVEPMNEEIVVFDVDHQRSRGKGDGVRKGQSPHWSLQFCLDPDDAGLDVNARRKNIAHH